MPELLRLEGMTAKIESVYKTDPTPTTADNGVQVEEALHDNMRWDFLQRNLRENLAHSSLGRVGTEIAVGRFIDIQVTTALKGTNVAYSASVVPEFDPLMRACALEQTIGGSAGAKTLTYTLRSSGFESATVWAYSGSKLYKVNGCMGNARFLFTPGQIPRAVFALRGYLASVSQLALPSITYAYEAIVPPTVKGAGLTLNSVDPAGFDDLELDLGIKLGDRPPGNDTDGYAGVTVTDYDPHVKVTAERAAISAFDPWTLEENGTLFAWDFGSGSAQYNQIAVSGPKGKIVAHSGAGRDGIGLTTLDVRAQHTDATSEDAVSILFD